MSATYEATELTGPTLVLEPLRVSHYSALASIAGDKRIWENFTIDGSTAAGFCEWFEDVMREVLLGKKFTYAVRCKTEGVYFGVTGFQELIRDHGRATIGPTWLAPHVWGRGINTELRLLVLSVLFDELHIKRVQGRTTVENVRNIHAFERIGASCEGRLRHYWRDPSGRYRDYVIFSILSSEWPGVRTRLLERLARHNGALEASVSAS